MSRGLLVEVLGVDLDEVGTWWYRALRRAVALLASPVAVARHIAGIGAHREEVILHRTSWRHHDDGTVVLTFWHSPTRGRRRRVRPCPAHDRVGTRRQFPREGPAALRHLIAHAIRHLAFLIETDPAVSGAVRPNRSSPTLCLRCKPAMAGVLHPGVTGRSRWRSRR
jgi:hypothetical protein